MAVLICDHLTDFIRITKQRNPFLDYLHFCFVAFFPQLPPVAAFLLLVSADAVVVENLTLEYEDPDTGDALLCALCPPGTYVASPCTRTLDTVCLPCPQEHFTQFWNFLPKCLYCSVCEGDRVVREQCSAASNRVCECRDGYYGEDGFCVPHSRCPPGKGAKIIGNQTHTKRSAG